MAKTLCGGFQSAVGSGNTGFTGIGLSNHSATTIETLHDQTIRTAGTFSNLSCTVLVQGSGASTFRLRRNLANANQSISIPSSTTGFFEDISNTDLVVAGDVYDFQLVSGFGTTTIIPFVVFEATGNTTAIYGGTRAVPFSTNSATRFISLVSRPSAYAETVEAEAQIKIKEAGTWKNMDIKLSANNRITTTTWTSRINGVDGNMLVSVPASTSGHFEDTSNTDAVIVNDLLAIKMVTGTGGGQFDPETQKTEIEYSGDIFNMPSGLANDGVRAVPFNTTEYHLPIGINASSTESLRQIQIPIILKFTNLQVHVITNTITGSASTVKVRKNSADGNGLVSIPAGATGFFEDTVNSDIFGDGDRMAYEIITPNTSGTLSINMISTTGEEQAQAEIDKTFFVDSILEPICDTDFCENFNQYALIKLPTFRDKFNYSTQASADANWALTGSGIGVNAGTEEIDWDAKNNNTQAGTVFDLGLPISNTEWVYRFKLIINTATVISTTSSQMWVVVGDTETVDTTTAEDFIGIRMVLNNLNDSIRIQDSDGDTPNTVGDEADTGVSLTGNVGTPLYTEIKRTSASTYEVTIYSDVKFETIVARTTGICSPLTKDLRYLKIFKFASGGTTSDLDGTIDDIEFWNGGQQGDVTFEDDLKLKTVSFTDDFTSDNWTEDGSGDFTISGGVMNWETDDTILNHFSFRDILGQTVNDTKWTLRFKLDIENFAQGSDTTNQELYITLADTTNTATESNQDAIGLRLVVDNSLSEIRMINADGNNLQNSSGTLLATNISATTFFVEIKRTSATGSTISLFSDANYSTLIESASVVIPSTITALRFMRIQNRDGLDGTNDHTLDGIMDDIEFYNGESVLTDWLGAIGNDVRLDTVNKRINFDPPTGVDRDELIAFDLQTILDGNNADDENWTLRFKINTDTLVQGSSEQSASLFVGLDNNLDPLASATHNLILFRSTMDQGGAGPQFGAISSSLSRLGGGYLTGTGTATQFPFAWTTGTRFVELKRLSSTEMLTTLFTDANYTEVETNSSGVPLRVQDTIDSGITNLRFIRITTDSSAVANDTSYDGSIDDIEFYNGVSVPKTPFLEVKDFEDKFATDNWADVGAGVGVNTGTQVIDWTSVLDAGNNSTTFDLGVGNVSDTEWTLRFKYTTASLTAGDSRSKFFWIGLFDSDQNSNSETVQDAIAFFLNVSSSVPSGTFQLAERNNVTLTGGASQSLFTTTPTVGDVLYIELKRISSTLAECSIYSDRDYSILVERTTLTVPAGIVNLRFIGLKNRDDTSAHAGGMTGTVDDVEFWDKVSGKTHKKIWREVDE